MCPIRTSMGSCSTGTSTKTTPSVRPPSRSCRWQILPTWKATWWRRTSRSLTSYKKPQWRSLEPRRPLHIQQREIRRQRHRHDVVRWRHRQRTVSKARLVDSLVVGETGNIGNPTTPEELAYGRSLPKTRIPDFPIRGYEYYDYRDDVVNTTFVNFQDNDRRKTGALSFLLFTSAGLSTGSTISGAKFVNAKPVYFPKYDARFDNDNRGGNAYRTLSIHDPGRFGDRHPRFPHHAQRRRERQRRHRRPAVKSIRPGTLLCARRRRSPEPLGRQGRTSRRSRSGIPHSPVRLALLARSKRSGHAPCQGPACRPVLPSCAGGAHCARSQTARNSRSAATRAPCVPAPRSRSKPKGRKSLSVWPKWTRAHGSYSSCPFHQGSLRNGKGQHGRHCAKRNEDRLFQGRGCPLGQTGGRCSGQAGHSSNGSASQYSGQQIGLKPNPHTRNATATCRSQCCAGARRSLPGELQAMSDCHAARAAERRVLSVALSTRWRSRWT